MKKKRSADVQSIEAQEPTAAVESEMVSNQSTAIDSGEMTNGDSEATEPQTNQPSEYRIFVETQKREPEPYQVVVHTETTEPEPYQVVVHTETTEPEPYQVKVASQAGLQSAGPAPSHAARMSQQDRLAYMVPVYVRRLRDTIEINKRYLERGEGAAHEIEKRIKVLETLCAMVENGLYEVAAEYAIKHGIKNSRLQGGFGYPSLTGAHFDFIVSAFPNRAAELRELIYQRRMTAWKMEDRRPKVPDTESPALEEPIEAEMEETDEPDAA